MAIPIYHPVRRAEATLTPVTFEAIYDSIASLTNGIGSTDLRAGDVEEKALGRQHMVIGRQFDHTPGGIAVPERLSVMTFNEAGINMLAEEAAPDLPGHTIATVSFKKAGPEGTLDGQIRLLDSVVLAVDAEWRLDRSRNYLCGEFAAFSGRIGLDGLLFGQRGRLDVSFEQSDLRTYPREGTGRRIENALKGLKT